VKDGRKPAAPADIQASVKPFIVVGVILLMAWLGENEKFEMMMIRTRLKVRYGPPGLVWQLFRVIDN
jgi:hypothetical protein